MVLIDELSCCFVVAQVASSIVWWIDDIAFATCTLDSSARLIFDSSGWLGGLTLGEDSTVQLVNARAARWVENANIIGVWGGLSMAQSVPPSNGMRNESFGDIRAV
eukprot:4955045-Amphidinium_carterae.1